MEINWYEIIVQLIGIVGIIAGLSALQCNKHSHALMLKMTEEASFGVQYLLLGGYTGAVLNTIGIFRNLIFTYPGKRDMQKELKYARIILGILFAVLGLLQLVHRFHRRRVQRYLQSCLCYHWHHPL